jgi:hypothetical protein
MSKRLDKIKAARSINEILEVVSDIAYEFKNSSAVVSRIVSSLSASLVMDVRDTKPSKQVDTEFKAPKLADLKKHVDVVHKMYDNVLELDAAEAMIKQSFAGNKKLPAALAAIKDLKRDIDDSINDAFDALGAIAAKHVPTKLSKLVDSLTSHIIDVLPTKTYKNVFRQLYVIPDPTSSGIFHFCDYIGIEGLKNDQGFTYDQYYVVVTGVVQKNGVMTFHVNGLPDFKAPGRYPLGKEVLDIAAAKKHVNLLLDHNNFVTDFEKKPMPIDTERAAGAGFTNIKGVDSVKVVDDELLVILKPDATERQIKSLELDVRARLNSVVGARKNDTVFQSKLVRNGSRRALKFILVPNVGRKMDVSLQKLDEVSELMNLTDKQKAALRFALYH